jgi:hypothetical protein
MQSRKKEKRLTKPQIGRGKNYCVFFCQTRDAQKTIDQLYKRKPKEYLGGERKEEKIIEF